MIEAVLHVKGELDVVNSGEIDGTAWLRFFWVNGCAPAVDVRVWDVGMGLVWSDEAEVSTLLLREAWQIVEFEVNDLDRIFEMLASIAEPVVDIGLALTTHCPDELDDWMVEVQIHAHLTGSRGDLVALHLRDELLE